MLIEAFPPSAAQCRRNRGDHCIHTAVCEKTGNDEDSFVEFVGTNDGLSYEKNVGETFNADKHFSQKKPSVQRVPCKPISEIFAENGIGPIDIWSLDVENAEVKVLRTMDWVQNPVNLGESVAISSRQYPPSPMILLFPSSLLTLLSSTN